MSKYRIDDEFLYENMKDLEVKFIDTLPREEDLSYEFSKRFQKKMNKLIKQEKRSTFMDSFIKSSKKIAVIFVVTTSILFISTISIEAYRLRFFEVVTKVFQEFTSISFKTDEDVTDMELIKNTPQYIPEGFEILEEDINEYVYRVIYVNMDNEEIVYQQNIISNGEILLDTEGVTPKTMKIGDQKIDYFTNKGVTQLYWNDDLYIYLLISTTGLEKLTKMAESIVLNN